MSKIEGTLKEEETEWEEVKEADLYEFKNKGDSIEGQLIHTENEVGKFKSKMYSIKQSNGNIKKIWGCKILDTRLMGITFGTKIKIQYEGEVKPDQGRPYNDFTVYKPKQGEA